MLAPVRSPVADGPSPTHARPLLPTQVSKKKLVEVKKRLHAHMQRHSVSMADLFSACDLNRDNQVLQPPNPPPWYRRRCALYQASLPSLCPLLYLPLPPSLPRSLPPSSVQVSFDEFEHGLRSIRFFEADRAALMLLFDSFDANLDGHVSWEEMRTILARAARQGSAHLHAPARTRTHPHAPARVRSPTHAHTPMLTGTVLPPA